MKEFVKDQEFLGIKLDYEKNKERISGNVDYSKEDSQLKYLKQKLEELMIIDTYRLLDK